MDFAEPGLVDLVHGHAVEIEGMHAGDEYRAREIVVILDHLDKRIRNTAKMLALHPFRDRILAELPERLPAVACNLIDGQNDGFGGGMLQAHFAVDAVELTLPVIEQMIADWEHADIASVEVRAIVPK